MLIVTKTLEELLSKKEEFCSVTISFLNPASYSTLLDAGFNLHLIDYWAFDSIFLAKLVNKLVANKTIDRLSFDNTSVFKLMCLNKNSSSKRVLMIGGEAAEAQECQAVLMRSVRNSFSSIKVMNGYFGNEFTDDMLNEMAKADIIVFSTGALRQEEQAHRCKCMFPQSKLIFTSGAFVSQTVKNIDYYPKWINKLHMRWAYRALHNRHVRRRLIREYPSFILLRFGLFRDFISQQEKG